MLPSASRAAEDSDGSGSAQREQALAMSATDGALTRTPRAARIKPRPIMATPAAAIAA